MTVKNRPENLSFFLNGGEIGVVNLAEKIVKDITLINDDVDILIEYNDGDTLVVTRTDPGSSASNINIITSLSLDAEAGTLTVGTNVLGNFVLTDVYAPKVLSSVHGLGLLTGHVEGGDVTFKPIEWGDGFVVDGDGNVDLVVPDTLLDEATTSTVDGKNQFTLKAYNQALRPLWTNTFIDDENVTFVDNYNINIQPGLYWVEYNVCFYSCSWYKSVIYNAGMDSILLSDQWKFSYNNSKSASTTDCIRGFMYIEETTNIYPAVIATQSNTSYSRLYGGDLVIRRLPVNITQLIQPMVNQGDHNQIVSTSSDLDPGHTGIKAMHGVYPYTDPNHLWHSGTFGSGQWIQVEFTDGPRTVSGYTWRTKRPSGIMPIDYELWGSNNGTDWTVLHTVVDNPVTLAAGGWDTHYMEEDHTYTHFRLNVTSCAGDGQTSNSYLHLTALQLFHQEFL